MSLPTAYDRELAVGIAAVRRAVTLCRAVQSGNARTALEKNDRSPVTVADFGSQALICAALHAAFADDAVMAEEDSSPLREPENATTLQNVRRFLGEVNPALRSLDADALCGFIDRGRTRGYGARFWTLDPIDGTKGFLRGEQYAIALALIVEGRVEVAVLGCPNLSSAGALFFAIRGGGAFMQPLDSGVEKTAIHVSAQDDAAQSRFCESVEAGHSAHDDAEELAQRLGISKPALRLDSQAKYAVVARGDADIYLRLPTRKDYREKLWDHAAGFLIISEAGGTVTDIDGKPIEFHHGPELSANRGVVASNGRLHAQLLAGIASIQARTPR